MAILLAAGGTVVIGAGIWGNPPPPRPSAIAESPAHQPTPSVTPTAAPAPVPAPITGPILAKSHPTRLTIPAIGVDSSLMTLGQNQDGSVQVPPLGTSQPAGWYKGSPTPGELGPAVILGHVDAPSGRSVFYRLGDIRRGDHISVTRADGTVAVFTAQRVSEYPKDAFPTLQVYGNTDRAELRLITCGGDFNHSIGHYVDNIVVYARLTSSHIA
ncbi:class F sortase [Microbacterium elymi]|uniref:Class F sortase n=1 Tax=Microbacterium elymi TaxID=2909587 RepID=A0ABY5NK94_9MICO|nr:class F sortase [Microbacterium elymi]UUT35585.1 class F sortase [Microbacterium elymi]